MDCNLFASSLRGLKRNSYKTQHYKQGIKPKDTNNTYFCEKIRVYKEKQTYLVEKTTDMACHRFHLVL